MPLLEVNGERRRWDSVERGLEHWGLRDWWLSTFSKDEREYIERVDFADQAMDRKIIEDVNDEIVVAVSRPPRSSYIPDKDRDIYDPEDASIALENLSFVIDNNRSRRPTYSESQIQSIVDRIRKKAEEVRREIEETQEAELAELEAKDAEFERLRALLRPYRFYAIDIHILYEDSKADPTALNKVIEACEKQIALAPEEIELYWRINAIGMLTYRLPRHEGYYRLAMIREKQKNYVEAIRLATEAKEQGWDGDWDKRIERCKAKLLKQEGKG